MSLANDEQVDKTNKQFSKNTIFNNNKSDAEREHFFSSSSIFCLCFWGILSSLIKACENVCVCVCLFMYKQTCEYNCVVVVVKSLLSSMYREAQGQKLNDSTPWERFVYITTCILGTFDCILIFFSFFMLVLGVMEKKFPSFLFSSEEVLLPQAMSISGLLLKFAEKIITFMNLIPCSYAYAIWDASFSANGFTAASVSNR